LGRLTLVWEKMINFAGESSNNNEETSDYDP